MFNMTENYHHGDFGSIIPRRTPGREKKMLIILVWNRVCFIIFSNDVSVITWCWRKKFLWMGTTYLCLCCAQFIPLGHTDRIDVYIGHKFCHRMLMTCVTLMSRDHIKHNYLCQEKHVTPNDLKKHFLNFSFVTMSIKSEILQLIRFHKTSIPRL